MMNNIKKTSHVLATLFRLFTWLIPLSIALMILFNFEGLMHLGIWDSVISSDNIQNSSSFSLSHRLFILMIQFIPLSVTVMICDKLAKLFKLYENECLFEVENIKLIKQIGVLMLLGQLLELLYQPLMSLALTFNNPAGHRMISLSFGSTNGTTIITGIIIITASKIVHQAHQLKCETELTI
jgi:Protein of unknown function (DUF2975)